jgi:hypothetical protein
VRAKKASVAEEIATVPAAPPSKLSKKFIELHIPTTQKIVITASKMFEPVGLPTLFVTIKTLAVNIPAILCAINRGRGDKFFMSSHKPISPRTSAGPRTDVANQKVVDVKSETKDVEYEIEMMPMMMATPPR